MYGVRGIESDIYNQMCGSCSRPLYHGVNKRTSLEDRVAGYSNGNYLCRECVDELIGK